MSDEPHGLEVARRLGRREPQVARPDLDEAAARAEASERDRRIGARPDDHVGARRQVLEEVAELLVDRRRLDDVEVVQHEDDVASVAAASPFRSVVTAASTVTWAPDEDRPCAASPTPGAARSMASMT